MSVAILQAHKRILNCLQYRSVNQSTSMYYPRKCTWNTHPFFWNIHVCIFHVGVVLWPIIAKSRNTRTQISHYILFVDIQRWHKYLKAWETVARKRAPLSRCLPWQAQCHWRLSISEWRLYRANKYIDKRCDLAAGKGSRRFVLGTHQSRLNVHLTSFD